MSASAQPPAGAREKDRRPQVTGPAGVTLRNLDAAIEAAADGVFRKQRSDGSWQDTLPLAATATASCVIALFLADPGGSNRLIEHGAEWLRRTQDADGGWGEAAGAPASINATAMAIAALNLVAPEKSAEHVTRGLGRLDDLGGMAALTDLSRSSLGPVCLHYLSLSGLSDERQMVRIPVELSLFPRAIQRRYCFSFPGLMSWGVMQAHVRKMGAGRRLINRLAEPRALAFLDRVCAFGGHGGGFEESPLMVSLVCIGLARAGVGQETMRHCVDYMHETVRDEGAWAVTRDLEFTATAIVTIGLHEAGRTADSRLELTREWIRGFQMDTGFAPTGCPPGGWQWSRPSGWPGSLDTADGVTALSGFGSRPGETNLRRGIRWLLSMQNGDGSWSYFCRNSFLPVDAPCSFMTTHAVTALCAARDSGDAVMRAAAESAIRRSLARSARWFGQVQQPGGSVASAWYTGLTAGTAGALASLNRLGQLNSGTARRCREWLLARQNEDGGWGNGAGGPSTAEETSWALLALTGAPLPPGNLALSRGARWLVDQQRPDGQWKPALVGMYMHDLLFASDHFANGYALQAIGRVRNTVAAQEVP